MKATSYGSPLCTSASAVSRRALLFAGAASAFGAPAFDLVELHPQSGEVLLAQGVRAETPVLPGSLVKPFTALAYERTNRTFPTVTCTGCWGGKAHGQLGLAQAIAVSCNRYFEELSLRVDPRQMHLVTDEYQLPEAPDSVDARLGLGREWHIAPAALLKAYLRLRHPAIREGMRLCASRGTAKAIGVGLAKTGTAPCEHVKRMPGDGLAVWLWPEDSPRRAVLVREHGVPGSIAAKRIRSS